MILEIISASECAMHKRNTYLPLPLFLLSAVSLAPLWTRKRVSLPFNRVYIINYSALGLLSVSFALSSLSSSFTAISETYQSALRSFSLSGNTV